MPLDIFPKWGWNEHPLEDCYRLWIQDGSQKNTDLLVELIKYYEKEMWLWFFSFLRNSWLNMQQLIDLAEERLPRVAWINLLEIVQQHTAQGVVEIYKNDIQRTAIQSWPQIVLQNS